MVKCCIVVRSAGVTVLSEATYITVRVTNRGLLLHHCYYWVVITYCYYMHRSSTHVYIHNMS